MAFRVSQTVAFLAVLATFFGQSGPQWQVRASEVRRCGEGFKLCRRPKSPDTPSVQLQHPTSSTIQYLDEIRWEPVPNAHSYRIQIQGLGVSWGQETTQTVVNYPASEFPLRSGNAYRLVVLALDSNRTPIAVTTLPLNVQAENSLNSR